MEAQSFSVITVNGVRDNMLGKKLKILIDGRKFFLKFPGRNQKKINDVIVKEVASQELETLNFFEN